MHPFEHALAVAVSRHSRRSRARCSRCPGCGWHWLGHRGSRWELLNSGANAPGNVTKRGVLVVPLGDRSGVTRQALQVGEGRALPIDGPQNNGNDLDLAVFMAFQGPLHLNIVAIVGGQEVGTDKQKNDRGRLQMLVTVTCPFVASKNLAIMPLGDA